MALADLGCAVIGVFIAAQVRFGSDVTSMYLALSLALPVLWVAALWLAGAYDVRFIGTGSDEFRKVLNAGMGLTAAVAIFSYAINLELSRAYVVIALPSLTVFDLLARYAVRKRLHRRRMHGKCLHSVVAVGHELAVADLVTELRRDRYHGLNGGGRVCRAARRARRTGRRPGLRRAGRHHGRGQGVRRGYRRGDSPARRWTASGSAASPGSSRRPAPTCASRRRCSTWPVRGRRSGRRPGLTLLHVDHPQLSGFRLVFKGLFDRCAAGAALVMLAPLMTILASAVWLHDRGPALFTQVRVGKDGHAFRIYKFRTMVVDAEQRRVELLASNDSDGVLFKLHRDPRVTPVGARLRRWSIDELPQLFNVFLGHMSLVGPRPALPDEADKYAEHVRRRLVVKPGLTGLWQVSGRSDLSWEESVRLDLRYVENWSFALDLQIMWKTISVLVRGSGAY